MADPVYSNLSTPRFHTTLDPYLAAVDNRPLKDTHSNLTFVGRSTDAALDSGRAAAVALGFVARGYATSEMMVGTHTLNDPSAFDLAIQHAFLIQHKDVSGTDLRVVPKIGVSVEGTSFVLTKAATVGYYRLYAIDARITTPDASVPHYDATNPAYATVSPFDIGGVEFDLIDDGEIPNASPSQPPTAVAFGWTRLAVVRVPETAIALDEDYFTWDNYRYDGVAFGSGGGGVYELNVDSRVVGTAPGGVSPDLIVGVDFTDIDNIVVDVDFAQVYIDGVFQTPSNYEKYPPSKIRIDAALPTGTRVDILTTAGGRYTTGKIWEDVRIAEPGESVFNQLQCRPDFSSLYIDGLYQPRTTWEVTGSDQITLNVPLTKKCVVILSERSAGLADNEYNVPSGGNTGDVLTKVTGADFDYAWLPPTGGGASLPPADPVADLGKALVYTGLDLSFQPTYAWRTIAGDSTISTGFLHEEVILPVPAQVVATTRHPGNALIFLDGAFQGKRGTDYQVTDNVNAIDFLGVLPAGSKINVIYIDNLALVSTQRLETALLALVNCQAAASRPNVVVHNACNAGDGMYMVGSFISSDIAVSMDYGRSWNRFTPTSGTVPDEIGGITRLPSGRFIAVGVDGVSYSDDLGANWTQSTFGVALPASTKLMAVVYNSETGSLVSVGSNGVVAYSTDSGASFSWNQVDTNLDLTDIELVEDGANGQWVITGVDGAGTPATHLYHSSVDPSLNTWTGIPDSTFSPATFGGGFTKVVSSGATWVVSSKNAKILYTVNPSVPTAWALTYEITRSDEATGVAYFDGLFAVFCMNNIAAVSMDLGSNWDEYILGNGDSNEVFTDMLVEGTSATILGGYDTARCFSKIRR